MARSEAVTCEMCGATKGRFNIWFCVDSSQRTEFLAFRAEAVPADIAKRYKDACGEFCVSKMFSQWCGRNGNGGHK